MGLDDRAADGQAHAQTIGFGGEEGLEHAFDAVSGESLAGIFHAEFDACRPVGPTTVEGAPYQGGYYLASGSLARLR